MDSDKKAKENVHQQKGGEVDSKDVETCNSKNNAGTEYNTSRFTKIEMFGDCTTRSGRTHMYIKIYYFYKIGKRNSRFIKQ